jgi:hypothetical protein
MGVRTLENSEYRHICKGLRREGRDMPDEIFRKTAGITSEELRLIDQVWADVSHQNRWRLRAWRFLNRLRTLPIARALPRLMRSRR